MEFSYRLVGRGWGEAQITDGKRKKKFTSSYITPNALGDLIDAIGAVLAGARSAECSWEQEPGEIRWVLDREAENVTLKVLSFRAATPRLASTRAIREFVVKANVRDVATAVAAGAQRLLDDLGHDEYQRQWDSPFPTESLEKLQTKLR